MRWSTTNNSATAEGCVFDKLPAELVSEIFMAVRDNARFVFQLSTVCRRWYDIALGTPMLWSTLDLELGGSNKHMPVLLERSKNAPLIIRIERTSKGTTEAGAEAKTLMDILSGILPHIHRWKELQVEICHPTSFQQIQQSLVDYPRPLQLQQLSFTSIYGASSSELDALLSYSRLCIDLSSAFVARLEGLSLSGVLPGLQSARLTGMTCLDLDECLDPISLSDLRMALSSCPNIQQLSLSDLGIVHDLQAHASPAISLSHLRSLSVSSLHKAEDTYAVLRLIRAPRLRALDIEDVDCWAEDMEGDILEVLSGTQSGYPTIVDLSVECVDSGSWASFLRRHCLIERLLISALDPSDSDPVRSALEVLSGARYNHDDHHELPLPSLKELGMVWEGQCPVWMETLVEMIRSARPDLRVEIGSYFDFSWPWGR